MEHLGFYGAPNTQAIDSIVSLYGPLVEEENLDTSLFGTLVTEDDSCTGLYRKLAKQTRPGTGLYETLVAQANPGTSLYGTPEKKANPGTRMYGTPEKEANPDNRPKKIFTELHLAAAKGNVKDIKKLIDDGFDVDVVAVHTGFLKGRTPLHLATEFKHIDAMIALLSKGADFTLRNGENKTPLMIAQYINWKEGVDLLIKTFCTVCSTINVNLRETFAQSGLLTDFDITISGKFRRKFEPINFAIQCGLEEIVTILVNHAFDDGARDALGMTELHRVVRRMTQFQVTCQSELCGYPEEDLLDQTIVRLFMEKYKNVQNPRDDFGRTPVFYLYKGLPERYLRQTFSSRVMIRTHWSRVYMLQQLLATPALCANIHWPDYEGNTILHTLAKAPLSSYPYIEGSTEAEFIVDRYLAYGGDIDALNCEGYTALHCCGQQGNVKVALVFLSRGAGINALTPDNDTPYSILCKKEFAWTFERLVMFSYIKRLVIIGMPLCPVNQRLYERDNEIWIKAADNIKRMILCGDECDEELKYMKSEHIDDYTTVYDILHKSVHDVVSHTRNERLTDMDFDEMFPNFGYLLKSKINKAKLRARLLEPAKESLLHIVKFEFPEACSNAILAHFENNDLIELINLKIDLEK